MINTRVSLVLPPSISATLPYGEDKVGGGVPPPKIVAALTNDYHTMLRASYLEAAALSDNELAATTDR